MSDEKVNAQIIDAVRTSTEFVMGGGVSLEPKIEPAHGIGTVYANTIAYPKVSQAAAFAIQDATDYLRNIMTLSATTQGVIFKLMVEHQEQAPLYAPILAQVQLAVTAAQQNLTEVGTAAVKIEQGFSGLT